VAKQARNFVIRDTLHAHLPYTVHNRRDAAMKPITFFDFGQPPD
jgi:hypothetical protein